MNKTELSEWMNGCTLVDAEAEVDGSCNRYETCIYQKGRQYYRLEYCNGHPSEKWVQGKGYLRGVYEPVEVFKKEEKVIKTFYLTEEELK